MMTGSPGSLARESGVARRLRAPIARIAVSASLVASCEDEPATCRAPIGELNERQASLPAGTDAWRCVVFGDLRTHVASEMPDAGALVGAAPGAVVFVRPGAAAGGDGSRERPFADLSSALRAPAASTVVLSRGRHALGPSITVTDARAIVGGGTDGDGTTIELSPGAAGLVVEGASASLTLSGVHVTYSMRAPGASDLHREIPLRVRGGAAMTLRDVLVSGGGTAGVLVEGAGSALDADRVTVRGGLGNGVTVLDGARALLRRSVAFRNAATGVYVERAHLHFFGGLVAGNAVGGVQYRAVSAASGGASSCAAEGPVAEGAVDCLREVSITCNGISGLYASGAVTVDVRRSVIADSRATEPNSGDGLDVIDGARANLDADLTATDDPQRDFATGTRVLANQRAGILVSGAGAALDLRGAVVESNQLGGVLVQRAASLQTMQVSRVAKNVAVGLAMAETTGFAEVTRCAFAETRPGSFTLRGTTISLGDGLSMASATGMRLTRSSFDGNARFGVLLREANGAVTFNRGDGNQYGLGVYGRGALVEENNTVRGRADQPAATPEVTPIQD